MPSSIMIVMKRRRQISSIVVTLACIVSFVRGAVVPATRNHATPPLKSKLHSKSTTTTSSSFSSKSSLSSSSSTSLSSSSASTAFVSSNRNKSPPWLQGIKNSVASSLAAATSKIILAPFDTIKTLQQHVRTTNQASSSALGLLEAARMITSRPRGFWELYAGLGVAVVGSMPSVGLYFGIYSYCKQRFQRLASSSEWIQQQDPRWVRMVTIALSAAIGNTLASASRVPYEVLKQKLQTNVYRNTGEALWDMAMKQGGLRAFFPPGAIAIQTIRDVPYAVVTLLSYEFLRRQTLPWMNTKPEASLSTNQTQTSSASVSSTTQRKHRLEYSDLLWGGLAGGLGSFVTNPFDVVKTRIQTSPEIWTAADASNNVVGQSILWKCFQMTWQEGGMQAFFRGSVPRLLHKVPANALFFVFYEFFRRLLHVQDDEDDVDHNGPSSTTPSSVMNKGKLPKRRS